MTREKSRKGQMKIKRAFALGLAILGLIPSCSSSRELPSPNTKPATPQGLSQWYQDCWSDFNMKNWDAFKKCYAPNASSQQAGYGKLSVAGPDAIVKASQDFMK